MSTKATVKTDLTRNATFHAEFVKIQVAEAIVDLMGSLRLSKVELARKLGSTPAFVTKILSGDNNFTLETMVKVGLALDQKIEVKFRPLVEEFDVRRIFSLEWVCQSAGSQTANKDDHECDRISYAA